MKAAGKLTIENVAFVNKIYIFWVSSWLTRIRISQRQVRDSVGSFAERTTRMISNEFLFHLITLCVCVSRFEWNESDFVGAEIGVVAVAGAMCVRVLI